MPTVIETEIAMRNRIALLEGLLREWLQKAASNPDVCDFDERGAYCFTHELSQDTWGTCLAPRTRAALGLEAGA